MTTNWTATLALFAALAFGGAPNVAQATLLNNGGFEDPLGFDFSDTSNWNGFFGAPAGTFLEAFNDTGAPANSGAQALELTIEGNQSFVDPNIDPPPAPVVVNGTNSFTGHVQTVPGIGEGDELNLSGFFRNNDSGLTGNVEFRIEFRGPDGMGGLVEISRSQILLDGLLTNEYQEFGVSGIAPAGTTEVNAVIAIATFNQDVFHNHSILVDDVSLTAIPEPTALALLGLGGLACVAGRRRSRV